MSNDNNGNHINIPGTPVVDPVMQFLEPVVQAARNRAINTMGIVAVDNGGNIIMCGGVGGRLGDMYVLLENLQIDVINGIRQQMQNQAQRKSIIPVRGSI